MYFGSYAVYVPNMLISTCAGLAKLQGLAWYCMPDGRGKKTPILVHAGPSGQTWGPALAGRAPTTTPAIKSLIPDP